MTANGYLIFRKSSPLFLQLAVDYPQIWSPNFTISMRHVLTIGEYPMIVFVFFDTILALAFALPPLVEYETCLTRVEGKEFGTTIEWVYGCPAEIILMLARINLAWAARLRGRWEGGEGWKEVEEALLGWRPIVEQADGSSVHISRLCGSARPSISTTNRPAHGHD
ncbi:hypothetical protein BDV93DRAFT_172628 [Ceratobasidium sp. AG-I]|nr:hypothetical protein BDV93DRAFT_172628 [Ceratobasidium sp. AG-I]